MKKVKEYNRKAQVINTRIKELKSIKELMARNINSKANSELIKYMERYPDDMFGMFLYGKLKLKLNDIESAKEAFLNVASSDTNNKYSAMAELANIATLENDFDTARMYYEKVVTESPNLEIFTIFAWSRLERRAKNYEKALQILNIKAVSDERLDLEKVKCLYLQDNLDEARKILSTLSTNTNDEFFNRSIYLEYAYLEKMDGTYEKAMEYIEKAKQGDKNLIYAQALYEETKLNIKYGHFDKALENCQELMSIKHPYEDAEIFLTRGIIYQGKHQILKATADYEMAITARDKNTKGTASYYLGNIMFAKGEFEKAEKLLVECISVYGELFVSGYFKLIALYVKEKRYEEAQMLLNEVVKQFPELKETKSYILSTRILQTKRGEEITPPVSTYGEKQIVNYNRELAINHINERHRGYYEGKTIFNSNISISDLYDWVITQITEDNMIYEEVMDTYTIPYPNIGKSENGEPIHHLRVIAVPNTKDIITMYPCDEYFLPRRCDYQQENKIPKIMSRVDKFNKKFSQDSNKK